MSTWILIMIIMRGYGVAIDHTAFDTRESCELAAKQLKDVTGSVWRETSFTCVEDKHD